MESAGLSRRTAGPERERETLRPLPAGGPRGGPRPLARAAAPRAPSALQSAGAQVPVGWTRLRMCRWPLLLLWGLLPRAAAGGSGWPFPHRTLLDSEGKYWLSWGPRGGRLAFRLEVRTAGYVGFGFSSTGAMAAADIVVGGVARGRPYLQVSAYIPSCSRPAEPPAGRDCGQAGAVGGAPRATRLSLRRRLAAVAPVAPQPQPGFRYPLPSALAPRSPRPLGLDSPTPPPSPRKAEHGKPRQLSVSEHFPAPNAPLSTCPKCTPATHHQSSLMVKERSLGFGDLRDGSRG